MEGRAEVRGPQGLPGEASAVKLLDLHLDTGGAAGLEKVQGLGQELVLPSTLVPASKAEEHLELRHPETHHHVLWRTEKLENPDPSLHRPVLPRTLGLSHQVGNATFPPALIRKRLCGQWITASQPGQRDTSVSF